MLRGLPDSLDDLLTPAGFAMLRNPTGSLAQGLRVDAEVCRAWTPQVPIRLYKVRADEQATTTNTDHCVSDMRSRGVRAPVIDVGETVHEGSRHLGSNVAGTAQVVRWFSGLG